MSGTNQRIDGKRLWDSLMAMAEIGATPKGGVKRLTLTDVDRQGRDRFRGLVRGAGPDGARGRHRQHVRPPRGPRPAAPAGAVRQPSRQPALGRQVRRRAGRDRGARGDAHAERPRHRHRGAGRAGELDRRGRQPLRPFADGLAAPGRASIRSDKAYALRDMDGVSVRRGAGQPSATRARTRRSPSRPMPISSCTSSRARSWSARASRSASSPAPRRRSGTTRCITGQDSHAGTTPPSARRDALVAAARVIDAGGPADARARRGRPRHGRLAAGHRRNSRNVVPGEVRF